MHDIDSTQGESDASLEALDPESFAFEFEGEPESEGESPFNEFEESELAEELLNVQSEEELEQFLGSLVKKAWRGVKKFAKSNVGKALGSVLKTVAKKALPVVGGALGSFIPVPGVGTMVGRTAGTALSNLFEAELEGLDEQEREFEVARRIVRLAGASAVQAAKASPQMNPRMVAHDAVARAARQISPGFTNSLGRPRPHGLRRHRADRGRWERRGRMLILFGA